MSLDYTTFFTRVGKCIKAINAFLAYQPTVLAYGTVIQDQYNTNRDLVIGVQQQFDASQSTVSSWEQNIKSIIDSTLSDLQIPLNSATNSATLVLIDLIAQMLADGQRVQKNTVSAPSIVIGASNFGSGTLMASLLHFDSSPTELAINETVLFKVTADQYGGSAAGGEQFSVVGWPTQNASEGVKVRGSGASSTATFDEGGSNLISNGDFESFSSAVPSSWTTVTGSSNISQETVSYHSGTSALRLTGDGVSPTVTLTQAVSLPQNTPVVLWGWLRKLGTVSAGSNLKIWISGTGISDIVLYNADPTALTTSYALSSLWSAITDVAPSNLTMNISWTAANTAGASAKLLIDDVVVARPFTFGDIQYAIIRGALDFHTGDKFTVTTANNFAGVIQTFFGRFYGVQLPSNTSYTIPDSLAL